MTAQLLVENCVLTNQTAVVDEMLNRHLLPEEYIYPIEEYGCCWWGRLASGQSICMDSVIRKIAGE